MRIEHGAPIVLVDVNLGPVELYHLAAPSKHVDTWNDGAYTITLPQALKRCTALWPTRCGLEGGIYSYGPTFRGRKLCAVCRDAAPRIVRKVEDRELGRQLAASVNSRVSAAAR